MGWSDPKALHFYKITERSLFLEFVLSISIIRNRIEHAQNNYSNVFLRGYPWNLQIPELGLSQLRCFLFITYATVFLFMFFWLADLLEIFAIPFHSVLFFPSAVQILKLLKHRAIHRGYTQSTFVYKYMKARAPCFQPSPSPGLGTTVL